MGIEESQNVFDNDETLVNSLRHLYSLYKQAEQGADSSFANEQAILDGLANALGLNSGFVVDVAASDGFTQSSTLSFFRKQTWAGLAIEMDSAKFSSLAFIYKNFPNAKLARNRVTPHNIVALLDGFEVPKGFEILNLDIDSYDLYVIDRMLDSGYRPQIVSIEINEKIPAGIFFTVDYDEKHYWRGDHFFGCSIDAACEVIKPYGYILYRQEYNNAFFVRADLAPEGFSDLSPQEAYEVGYKNRDNRKILFPWNFDVESWLGVEQEQAIGLIAAYFKKYEGKYSLRKAQKCTNQLPPQPF